MSKGTPDLTRGQFLKLGAGTLGGAALAASSATDLFALRPSRSDGPWSGSSLLRDGAADTIFVNGKVVTVDPMDTVTRALAVRDGLILQTGSDALVQGLAGPDTVVVDLGGRTVTPGFVDAHCHFQLTGLIGPYYYPFLPPEVTSYDDLHDTIARLAAGMEEGEWIVGLYLTLGVDRVPDKHDLDPPAPNNPVWIMHQGGHWGSANTRALEEAGLTADTPDVNGGIVERDAAGEPTGVFYNHRAMDLLRRVIPLFSAEDIRESMLSTQARFVANGVTSYQDNNIRLLDAITNYQQIATEGRAYLRQALYYTLEWPQDLDRALNAIDHVTNDFTRFAGFKFLLDGQAPTFYCHEPHNGTSWDMPTWDPQTFKDTVRVLHDTGLQICVHCGGDAAADLALDAYEEAMNANPRPDPRHRLEHAVITSVESTQRIRDLGVVVSTQPQFIRLGGDLYRDLLTPEQYARLIVTREWLDAGVNVALGSDAPTTAWIHPQASLYGAMTRLTYTDHVVGPEQAMTIDESVRAHTLGAAYAAHEEHIKGSLEVGKLADLVVWSADPYTSTPEEVYRSAIDLTMVGGEIVYLGPRPPRRRFP